MIYYFSTEQVHIRFKGDIVKDALYTEKEVVRFFGHDAFKYLKKAELPSKKTFRSFGMRFPLTCE